MAASKTGMESGRDKEDNAKIKNNCRSFDFVARNVREQLRSG